MRQLCSGFAKDSHEELPPKEYGNTAGLHFQNAEIFKDHAGAVVIDAALRSFAFIPHTARASIPLRSWDGQR
jgi:hypothetical protein